VRTHILAQTHRGTHRELCAHKHIRAQLYRGTHRDTCAQTHIRARTHRGKHRDTCAQTHILAQTHIGTHRNTCAHSSSLTDGLLSLRDRGGGGDAEGEEGGGGKQGVAMGTLQEGYPLTKHDLDLIITRCKSRQVRGDLVLRH